MNFNVELSMSPDWNNTNYIHEAVWNFIFCSVSNKDKADNVSMVSTELIENAIKYGEHDQDDSAAIHFYLRGDEDEIIVEVRNKIKNSTEENLKKLDETIQWIRGYQNPWEAYLERLQIAARGVEKKSRMGMVRMSYEASAIIDFFLNENSEISVSATIPR